MSRAIEFYLLDILIAVDKVKRYTRNFDNAQSFLYSELEWDAVIRELEIVGEATKNLLKQNCIDSQYQIIVDFRNHIAHGYFGIDENIVWDVVNVLLDQFTSELHTIIKENTLDMSLTIKSAKDDYSYSSKTIEFLNKLSKITQ